MRRADRRVGTRFLPLALAGLVARLSHDQMIGAADGRLLLENDMKEMSSMNSYDYV